MLVPVRSSAPLLVSEDEKTSFELAQRMLAELIETIPDSMSNFVLVKAQASGFGKQIGSFSVSHDIYPIR